MSSSWQRGPHSNENITGHSNVLSFTLGDRPVSGSRALVWQQRGSDIDGQADNEVFGSSVAMSDDGTVVVVGSPNGGVSSAGIVRVYAWDGTSWALRGSEFTSSSGDRLGEAVAMSGDGLTFAVSAPFSGAANFGELNILRWDGSSWVQRGTSLIGAAAGDEFGQALALDYDGTTLVASSTKGASDTGYVRVYELVGGTTWTLRGSALVGAANDRIGQSVAVSEDGNYIAFGAPMANPNGYVRVYEWFAGAWSSFGTTITGGLTQDFGRSISVSEDGLTVAIGSPTAPGGGIERGLTRIYRWGGSSWTQLGSDINGGANGEQSGWSVALSDDGNTVAIGAHLADAGGVDSGTTRVYSWQATPLEWSLESTFLGEAAGDISGHAVALSSNGRVVAIGGYYNAAGGYQRGHVRVYSYE